MTTWLRSRRPGRRRWTRGRRSGSEGRVDGDPSGLGCSRRRRRVDGGEAAGLGCRSELTGWLRPREAVHRRGVIQALAPSMRNSPGTETVM